jgi:hypothetical protein
VNHAADPEAALARLVLFVAVRTLMPARDELRLMV